MVNNNCLCRDDNDYLVCTCMGVMCSEIKHEIVEKGATTFQELYDRLGVGSGCNSCVPEVEEILQRCAKGRRGCCKKDD